MLGTPSQGHCKRPHKKDAKVVETLPWKFQSMELDDTPFVEKCTIGGELFGHHL